METPYSKQDEVIEEGVQALREQAVDTSAMAYVLNPKRRSIVLPVGLATAAAVAVGLVVLMTPTKADAASEFGKVMKAVQGQRAVVEKVMVLDKDRQTWEVKLEAWQDGKKKGVKVEPAKGGAEIVIDGKNKYVKKANEVTFQLDTVQLDKPVERARIQTLSKEVKLVESKILVLVDLSFIQEEDSETTINEILARDGMQFMGISRNGKKDGKAADIYRVQVKGEEYERVYYVNPKTDLPFLMEKIGADGTVQDRVEFSFPGTIDIKVKESENGVFEIVPDTKGQLKLGDNSKVDLILINSGEKTIELPVEKPKKD